MIVDLEHVAFAWPEQPSLLTIPRFSLTAGEQVFLSGPSGSGKSTLLSLIGGLLVPQSGVVNVLGHRTNIMSSRARDRLRGENMGFIFQQFNLIPYMSVLENVLLPCRLSDVRCSKASEDGGSPEKSAHHLLERLDLDKSIWHQRADRLSVGQQQRVAVARAFIGKPPLVIADEPSSALDTERQEAFFNLLQRECQTSGACLLFVSHDQRLAKGFSRIVTMKEINAA